MSIPKLEFQTVKRNQCSRCKHYISTRKCAAFSYIPNILWNDVKAHKTKLNNEPTVFEPLQVGVK
jgi:hypothetical protein